jgi:hypothetical protein
VIARNGTASRKAVSETRSGLPEKRWKPGDWIAVLALITSIIGIVVGAFGGVTGIRAEFFPPPDCGHHSNLKPVQPATATSTSQLASQGSTTYVAANAMDGNL